MELQLVDWLERRRVDSSSSVARLVASGNRFPRIRLTLPFCTGPAAIGHCQETLRPINVGFDLANELESVDFGRIGFKQEPAGDGGGKSLMQNIHRLRFIAPQFTPESGVNQLNAGELGHWLSHKKYKK